MSLARPVRSITLLALAVTAALVAAWSAGASPARHAVTRGPIVTLGQTDLGRVLVDARGRTLYLYAPDSKGKSTCYGQCASFWPPVLTTSKALARHGVKQSLLGITIRKDGKRQVTYAGHPLYFFAQDAAPGDVNGQGLQNIWYALSVSGKLVSAPPPPATIQLAQTALGSVLTDPRGMTLYLWRNDANGTSNCYGQCASNWPPLILNGKLHAPAGLQTSLLGTTTRTDGSVQVTYAGHPLYFYVRDTKAGDTNGQGVGNVWYVLSATGAQIGG